MGLTDDLVRVFPRRFEAFLEQLLKQGKPWTIDSTHNVNVFLHEREDKSAYQAPSPRDVMTIMFHLSDVPWSA